MTIENCPKCESKHIHSKENGFRCTDCFNEWRVIKNVSAFDPEREIVMNQYLDKDHAIADLRKQLAEKQAVCESLIDANNFYHKDVQRKALEIEKLQYKTEEYRLNAIVKMNLENAHKNSEIEEENKKLKAEYDSIRDFCFDLQLYIKDLILSLKNEGVFYKNLTFQQIRKNAYTHAKNPTWGDKSYFNSDFEKLDGLEYQLKDRDQLIVEASRFAQHKHNCTSRIDDCTCGFDEWLAKIKNIKGRDAAFDSGSV